MRLYQRGDTVYVHLAQDPPTAGDHGYDGVEDLTLRVIVPKRSYAAITVAAERAQVRLTNLRSDFLTFKITDGSAQPVSYTHLDVYKRQGPGRSGIPNARYA